jgi:Xaa-Pro aminopeptidase
MGPPFFMVRRWATIPLMRFTACLAAALLSTAHVPYATAQDSRTVYRCPGPPVLYTDALSVQEARDRNCRTIEGANVTVVQVPPRRPASPPAAAPGAAPNAAARPAGDTRIDPASQRARDADARRILQEELQREEERLTQLRAEFNNGEPERRGDERNFARFQERVAEMRAAILRKEADIAALKRELSKLAPS